MRNDRQEASSANVCKSVLWLEKEKGYNVAVREGTNGIECQEWFVKVHILQHLSTGTHFKEEEVVFVQLVEVEAPLE